MIKRRLQLSMASVAAIATILLGVSQQNALIPIIGIFSGSASYIFTDRLEWFRLDRRISYVAMILAAVFSLNRFWENTSEEQLLAIANMLVFVQIALLFQEKNLRIYSHLAVFSVLQVVVAALLNNGIEFGLMLALYLMVGFFAMSYFFLHRESERLKRTWERHQEVWAQQQQPATASRSPEWRRALGGPMEIRTAEPTEAPADRILSTGFTRHIAATLVATLAFTAFYFYLAPRTGMSWADQMRARRTSVGFTTQVSLTDVSDAVQTNELVMRVEMADGKTGAPYLLYGEPYFRGVVLTTYSSDDRRSRWHFRGNFGTGPLPDMATATETDEFVRMTFNLEPSKYDTLFTISPAFKTTRTPLWLEYRVRQRTMTRQQLNPEDGMRMRRYEIATSGFRSGAQMPITPHRSRSRGVPQLNSAQRLILLQMDASRFPTIQRVSDELMQSRGAGEGRIFRARVLMNYLLSDRFNYTLKFSTVKRTPGVDPIEDFFANHHQGHCEYFSSALVMMLRSQGIPARMVVGFKGGDFNNMGGYLQVRSRHAHAWVEAYLEPGDIPFDTIGIASYQGGGAWLRLDPTPSDEEDEFDKGVMGIVDQVLDYSQLLWNDYVLGINRQQQEDIYRPTSRRVAGNSFTKRSDLRKWIQRLIPPAVRTALATVLAIGLVVMVTGFIVVSFFPRLSWPRWLLRRSSARSRKRVSSIEFYRRFEAVLRRAGFTRRESQTQQEFAEEVVADLDDEHRGADDVPKQIVSAFYRVRFGGRPLDTHESEAIESALRRLEQALT